MPGARRARAALVDRDDRLTLGVDAGARGQEVLDDREPRVGEEARLPEVLAALDDPSAGFAEDPAVVPHQTPEFVRVLDRPRVERLVVPQAGAPPELSKPRRVGTIG